MNPQDFGSQGAPGYKGIIMTKKEKKRNNWIEMERRKKLTELSCQQRQIFCQPSESWENVMTAVGLLRKAIKLMSFTRWTATPGGQQHWGNPQDIN